MTDRLFCAHLQGCPVGYQPTEGFEPSNNNVLTIAFVAKQYSDKIADTTEPKFPGALPTELRDPPESADHGRIRTSDRRNPNVVPTAFAAKRWVTRWPVMKTGSFDLSISTYTSWYVDKAAFTL